MARAKFGIFSKTRIRGSNVGYVIILERCRSTTSLLPVTGSTGTGFDRVMDDIL